MNTPPTTPSALNQTLTPQYPLRPELNSYPPPTPATPPIPCITLIAARIALLLQNTLKLYEAHGVKQLQSVDSQSGTSEITAKAAHEAIS